MMMPMRCDRAAAIAITAAASLLISGCQWLGPASVDAGRAAYNDVIARTNSEQTLGVIVRMRYGDPIGMLSVSSVTANLKFAARAGGEAGIGSKSGYAGNLVPFSAGVAYEDSPTISYTPVEGQSFLAEWLKPVALDLVIRSAQTAGRGAAIFGLLVDRMNHLRSGVDASPEERAGFARAMALIDELHALGIASWVAPSIPNGGFELRFSDYAPAHTAQVEDLLALLDSPGATRGGAEIRIPVTLRAGAGGAAGLELETRSMGAIMLGAAFAIEVPEEHVQAGVVTASPAGAADGGLRIHASSDAPDHASLAVEHRGFWYYVDDTDLASKRTFQQIQMLFLSTLAEASKGAQGAPMLTIPVK